MHIIIGIMSFNTIQINFMQKHWFRKFLNVIYACYLNSVSIPLQHPVKQQFAMYFESFQIHSFFIDIKQAK